MSFFTRVVIPEFGRAIAGLFNANFSAIETGFTMLETYAADTGAADAYVVDLTYTAASYTDGMEVKFKAANANTGASTINVNSLGVKSIKHQDGSALDAGDIPAGGFVYLLYDSTAGYFKTSVNSFSGSFAVSSIATAMAAATHSATTKATPVDADEFSFWDSVGTVLKKATWANIKTTLGSTFAALAGSASQSFAMATATQGTNTTQGASTAFVMNEENRHRNKIRNGNFVINQRAVSGTVNLSAGQYGHDGWKGGSSGCTYTFAKYENVTTLTITAGSLQQVVDGEWLFSGTHCLSWTGTAQGKIGAGSYSASGVTGTATGGTNLTIEFNTGTLSLVQLEPSATPTIFEFRDDEPQRNLRYYYRIYPAEAGYPFGFAWTYSATVAILLVKFPVSMRAAPTALEQSGTANQYATYQGNVVTQCSSVPAFSTSNKNLSMTNITVASGLTVGWSGIAMTDLTNGAGAYLGWSAEL